MMIANDVLVKIGAFALAACGFLIARHIHNHKKADAAPLVCPIGFDCHAVVHSDYSKFLGVPVEIFGMIHYLIVSLLYVTFIIVPEAMTPLVMSIVVMLSMIAFLFSLYLISIQLFVLKKGCFWCYISSLISILIFVLTLLAYDFPSLVQNLMR